VEGGSARSDIPRIRGSPAELSATSGCRSNRVNRGAKRFFTIAENSASHHFARQLRLSELGYSIAVFTSRVLASLEARMRRICLVVAAVLGFGAVVAAAEEPSGRPGAAQPTAPAVPPASGTSSSDLNRSGGVITPPADIDPDIKRHPPSTETPMPIIPPPGTPGGNPAVKPK
jgi:hypothetical protein